MSLVPAIALPGRAELLKNLKTDGSIETRSIAINNETDVNSNTDDYRNETNTRLMVGASFDLLDDVHARLLLDRAPRYGTGGQSVTNVENSLIFDNAYVKIDKVFGAVDSTIGRQFVGDSDDLNIYFGPQNDDLLSVTALDAFRADAVVSESLGLRFMGVAGKTSDATAGTRGTNTDATVYGGELGTDKVIPMGSVAAYYYTLQTHAVKPPALGNDTLSVGGLRFKGDILTGLGYHVEFLQNFGRNNSATGTPAHTGSAYFANVHFGKELSGRPIRAHLEYGRGSRDFQGIAPGRRFGLIWGQHSNFGPATFQAGANRVSGQVTGLAGITVADAGFGINPISKLGVDVNAYRFMYDAVSAGVNGRSAGTEYDLILSWKHSDNVSFEVNAATFQVGGANQNAGTATNPITRLGADVKVKF